MEDCSCPRVPDLSGKEVNRVEGILVVFMIALEKYGIGESGDILPFWSSETCSRFVIHR